MRILESTTISGQSGDNYAVNMYPADMRFNDFIPGVFVLYAEDDVLYIDQSDNVDLWLQKNSVADKLSSKGFSRIGFIRNGNPARRQEIMADLAPVVQATLKEV
jgi:hypothetical protein